MKKQGPPQAPTLVEGSPIVEVIIVVRLVRREAGFAYREPSWPGHQLQYIEAGRLHIESGGRKCDVGPGTLMWFHDNEDVQGRVLEAPWVFFSVNFIAPTLPPPDFEHRFLFVPKEKILRAFQALQHTWLDTRAPPLVRLMRVHARLLDILAAAMTPGQRAARVGRETVVWWQVEIELRKDLNRPIDVALMSQLVKRSPATITRCCRLAVGVSPSKRVKQLRLSMARRLVWLSRLTFTEIADRIGYPRVHELSRDYHKCFGVTPSADREEFPRIYQREFLLPFTSENEML